MHVICVFILMHNPTGLALPRLPASPPLVSPSLSRNVGVFLQHEVTVFQFPVLTLSLKPPRRPKVVPQPPFYVTGYRGAYTLFAYLQLQ